MQTIYLDQNKWIELAQVRNRVKRDRATERVLDLALERTESGALCFPLSAIHYMELSRVSNPARRERLGAFMWDLSLGKTLVSHRAIIEHELEFALAARHPSVRPAPFTLVGEGVAHAFGQPTPRIPLPDRVKARVPPERWPEMHRVLNREIERSWLTGVDLNGQPAPPFKSQTHRANFADHLEQLHVTLVDLPKEKWDDLLLAVCFLDIQEPVRRVLQRHRLPLDAVTEGGADGMRVLLRSMPSRQVDIHLHRQVVRNPNLRPRHTDLEDWAGLGPAVAYCDIVVCERHFASLVGRSGFRSKATVLTELMALGELLAPAKPA